MFFDNWMGISRIIVVGVLAYVALVLLLRVLGKRTLSKMNAFDMIVTVALGSTLATTPLSEDVALAEGVVAFAVLIGLQFAITWTSVRSAALRRIIQAEPTLLFYQGQFLHSPLQAQRVTEDEIRAAIREQGIAALEQVEAVVLETDASFTVIERSGEGAESILSNVGNYPPSATGRPPAAARNSRA